MKLRTTQEEVMIHPGIVTGIRDHSQQQHAKGGYEAVGLLAERDYGDDHRIVVTVPLHNHAANPQEAFFVEPWEEWRAYTHLESKGYKISGSYHSHPTGEALPSQVGAAAGGGTRSHHPLPVVPGARRSAGPEAN